MKKLLMDVPEYLVHPCPNRSFPGRQPPRQRLLDYPYTHTPPAPRMIAPDMRGRGGAVHLAMKKS